MRQPNTAFFHPSRQVQPGIRLHSLYRHDAQEAQQGLLLGAFDRKPAFEHGDPDRKVMVDVPRKDAVVVWCLDGHPLAGADGILRDASVMRVQEGEALLPFLTRSFGDGSHLVLVRTGLIGRNVALQAEKHAAQGIPAMAHGVLALDGGATLVAQREGIAGLPELNGLPAISSALYELAPGSEIAVCDLYPGSECRIKAGTDGLERLPLPDAAIAKVYAAMHLARYGQERQAA
jgi:hypothetical protein